MNDYTYIVFGTSGVFYSRLLKEHNKNCKVIHISDEYSSKSSQADVTITLTNVSFGNAMNEKEEYKTKLENKIFRKLLDDALNNNIKKVTILDGIEDSYYSLMLLITNKILKKNIFCINIFFKPFSFMGKYRLNRYKKFFTEINKIKSNNYFFECDILNNYGIMKYEFSIIFSLVDTIAFNISIDLEKDINSIIDNTIKKELPFIKILKKEEHKIYKYVSIIYDDDIVAKTINEPSFYYKTDLNDIYECDRVLVDRKGKETVGIVIDVDNFIENDVPYPIEKTKSIIKKIDNLIEPIDLIIRKRLISKYYLHWHPKNNIYNKEDDEITSDLLINMYNEYIDKLHEFIGEVDVLKKQITKINFTPNFRQTGGYRRCVTNYPDKGWKDKHNQFLQAYKELMVDFICYDDELKYDELSINELDIQIEMANFLIKQAKINISELTESK